MAIGASAQSTRDGIIGETGAYTDEQRSYLATLLMIIRMINAPIGSTAHAIIRRCLVRPRRSIGLRGENILREMKLDAEGMEVVWSPTAKARVKIEMRKFAEESWRQRVASSSRLSYAYPHMLPLRIRGYLSTNFRGRRLITLLRIDDLPLAAASWLAYATGLKECWCRGGNETREHFLLTCPALSDVREAHMHLIPALRPGVDQKIAMTYLLLGSDSLAAENIDRAKVIGAFVADLWQHRGQRSGKHQETFQP